MGENKTEEEYRLLAEESKERFDELTERIELEVGKNTELFKIICVAYSFFRLMDDTLDNVGTDEELGAMGWVQELSTLASMGRTEMSNILEKNIGG